MLERGQVLILLAPPDVLSHRSEIARATSLGREQHAEADVMQFLMCLPDGVIRCADGHSVRMQC